MTILSMNITCKFRLSLASVVFEQIQWGICNDKNGPGVNLTWP